MKLISLDDMKDLIQNCCHKSRIHEQEIAAVLFLDMDRFNALKETFDTQALEQIIQHVIEKILEALQLDDFCCRAGDDEFIIFIDKVQNKERAIKITRKIQAFIAKPVLIKQVEINVNANAGIVIIKNKSHTPSEIIRNASIAMRESRSLGYGQCLVYKSSMQNKITNKFEMETDLRRAIRNSEFVIYYQPILDIKTLKLVGCEALIRWKHPQKGLLLPGQFIDLAVEIGLIQDIDSFVLDKVCQQIKYWQNNNYPEFVLSLNLTTKFITGFYFVRNLQNLIFKNRFNPKLLKIELSESIAIETSEETIYLLKSIKDIGVSLAIDDFGTGYSSLKYLHKLPIQSLKIDKSFVSEADKQTESLVVIKTIIQLGKALGVQVVAEGVENARQIQFLDENGCDLIQGFYLSLPLDEKAFNNYVKNGAISNKT